MMIYLLGAYSIIWLLIGGYVWTIGKRQNQAMKELGFLQELEQNER